MRRRADMLWALSLTTSLVGSGCAVTRRMAVDSMVPILENTAAVVRERSDLGTVETALPANMLLLDGLIRTDPHNFDFLSLGAYFYFGYALGFVEEKDPGLAKEYYAAGRDYGLRALDRRGAFRRGRLGSLTDFERGLRSLRQSDMRALAWAGANWGRWLSLNLDSPAAIAQMPHLQALLERMLELDPTYERGLPHALLGTYDALRPRLFGGDPERARQHFEAALRISERKMLLYEVFYAEFYCRQILDVQCFRSTLDEVQATPADVLPDARLMNEIARRWAVRLRAREEDLF